jgi:PmbA protein
MEKLLQMAKKKCDKAEVYSISYNDDAVFFENAKLNNIDSKVQSGLSLRIVKDGKLGFAYTRNLIDRGEFLRNALDSLEGGVEAKYDFPLTQRLRELDTYDRSIEKVSSSRMVEECTRVCEIIKSRADCDIEMASYAHTATLRILNTAGTDVSMKTGAYGTYAHMIYPGTAVGLYRVFESKTFEKMPDDLVIEMIDLYRMSSEVVEPAGGRMKVVFMPNSMITLNWRVLSGTSSKSAYEKTSPVADKMEEKIFDDKITIYDDPLDDARPGARSFDDEGVACRKLTLIQNGVLKNLYYDLEFANKLKAEPTGHGYRTSRWGGDPIALKPAPSVSRLTMKPGNKSLQDLVRSMDRGIIIENALGAHSGNIPNGDYSIGANPALYVEKGEIVGRVKDAMVAGNVYETLKNVVDVGDTLYPSHDNAWVPAMLCDDVSVAMKG